MGSIGESAALAVVKSLVGKLGALFLDEVILLGGVRDKVREIRDELESIIEFLKRAEEVPGGVAGAQSWVRQLRRLAYNIDDCIDEFTLRFARRPDEHGLIGCLRRIVPHLKTLLARHRIATEIANLKASAVEVSNRRSRYLVAGAAAPDPSGSTDHLGVARGGYDPRVAALFVEESELVGTERRRKELIQWLSSGEPSRIVVSVFGMGGLGKTTLARKLYQRPEFSFVEEEGNVKYGHFHCRAWITVSHIFEIKTLLKDLIRQLLPSSVYKDVPEAADQAQLTAIVRDHLQDKRYLVVLDDVWRGADWNAIAAALPSNTNRSRILVTTRNDAVAHACSSPNHRYVYQLEPLSSKLSFHLFCKKVFGGDENSCPPYLKPPAEDILKKCGGLPLAIVTIAGLLASKPSKSREEWSNLKDRLPHEMESNPSLDGMNRILDLSYNDLPSRLKHCFLYLSMLPEDYTISRKRLIRLWMAQGFVSSAPTCMTLEEVGEDYFNELISRSLIQASEFGKGGRVRSANLSGP